MNKKMMLSALGIVAAVSSSAAFALTAPGGGVVGSIHDMNEYPNVTKDSQNRVCAFCHTPHHALTTGGDYLPLWSHELPDTSGYAAYKSATIDSTISGNMMDGPSKLCMSCHDGTVAVDTHYSTVESGTLKLDSDDFGKPAVALSPSTLSNDHPIGFIYDDVAAGTAEGVAGTSTDKGKDNYIKNSSAYFKGNPANITIASRLFAKDTASKPIMTCATCHDVHNKKNVDDPAKKNYLLLSPNTNSQICLSCHIK